MILQSTHRRVTHKVVTGWHVQNLAVNAKEIAHAQLNFKRANPVCRSDECLWFVVHGVESFLDLLVTGHLAQFLCSSIH
jgi:hypothetical protein